jgi:hypothetical protein
MKAYSFGKILGGGAIDYCLSDASNKDEVTAKMVRDFRDQVLVESTGQRIEIVRDDSERYGDLCGWKFQWFDAYNSIF